MDERLRSLCAELVKMESEQAANWVLNRYPIESVNYGEALLLLPHRSWKKPDQKRLAQYYFKKLPFSGSKGYEAFSAFMSVKLMLECVRENCPVEAPDIDLLLYYVVPVLEGMAKNDADKKLIRCFVEGLGRGGGL